MALVSPQLRHGELVHIRGDRWRVIRSMVYDAAAVIEVTGCGRDNHGESARFLLPFEQVTRLPHRPSPRVVAAARWRHTARLALAAAHESPVALRCARRGTFTVMPFQLEPALALLRGVACRLLIADDVGLGKTIQAGLIIAELLERNPDARAIVICPAALREQWRAELSDRFQLEASIADAAFLAHAYDRFPAGANPWLASPVVITSIDYVKRPEVIRAVEALVWDAVVFDEAHGLAGRSDRSNAAALLAERARHLVMLTATPHAGDDAAFLRLCELGNLRREFPLLLFRRTRRDLGIKCRRRTTWLHVQPTAAEREMHVTLAAYARRVWTSDHSPDGAARLAMSVLIRRACSSASSLARSIRRRLALLAATPVSAAVQVALPFADAATGDEEPGGELGAPGLARLDEELGALTRVLDLAQRAAGNESKLAALHRLLRRVRQPAIVFTEYRDTLALLAVEFAAMHPLELHGGMTLRARREAARAFATGNALLLLATDAASEGLNLHHRCRLVVNLELPWTPTRLEQRVGRVDRIGQQRRVHAIHVTAAATAEQSVLARLLRRMVRVETAFEKVPDVAAAPGIAAEVIAGEPAPPAPALGPTWEHRTGDPELRRLAEREGAIVARARTLHALSLGRRPESRPVVTTLKRPYRRAYWVFRLEYADDRGRVVWSDLLALSSACRCARRLDRKSVTAILDARPVDGLVRLQHDALTLRTASALAPWLQLSRSRELAIIEAVGARRARLAALLIQPGLFGRAGSGSTAAQSAAADELLGRCAAHVRTIERSFALAAAGRELVFACLTD